MCLLGTLVMLIPAGTASAQSAAVVVPPQSRGSCAGQAPIVVGSDAAAQSDIYAAAMLAGVIGSDCIVLAGPRDQPVPADQKARLAAANAGGFVVGGIAAVPTAKIAGRPLTRLSGDDRWETARLVGRRAAGDTTAGTPTDQESTTAAGTGPNLSTIEGVFARAASQRATIVADLTAKMAAGTYGIDSDNVLRGPAGFRIDLSACPDGWSDTAGVTSSEIRVGYSLPQTGNLSRYGQVGVGMANYFDWVNANDPVAGREIVLIVKDDAYSAQRTIDNVEALIKAENVLSITTLGSLGTFATYDRLNYECMPHPSAQTGYADWGDPVFHPWTTGSQMAYNTEAIRWGTWIEQNMAAKLPVQVAAVVMDNNFGGVYEQAFANWAEAHPEVVSSFTPVRHVPSAQTLTTEMQAVANADPDVYISMTAGNSCLLAIQEAGQSGLAASIKAKGGALFTPSACNDIEAYVKPAGDAADGWLILDGGAKDSTDPLHADEPFIAFLNQNLQASGVDPSVGLYAFGYTFGYPYVEALRIAAELPGGITRTNLILAVRSLDIDHPMYHAGIRLKLDGNADAYPIEGSGVQRFDADAQSWGTPIEIIDVDGQTRHCARSLEESLCSKSALTQARWLALAAQGTADVNGSTVVSARAYDIDRSGPPGILIQPGLWQVSSRSYCLWWDTASQEWREGERGAGWIEINGRPRKLNKSRPIRIEHGDRVVITTWSSPRFGDQECELNWVADLD